MGHSEAGSIVVHSQEELLRWLPRDGDGDDDGYYVSKHSKQWIGSRLTGDELGDDGGGQEGARAYYV